MGSAVLRPAGAPAGPAYTGGHMGGDGDDPADAAPAPAPSQASDPHAEQDAPKIDFSSPQFSTSSSSAPMTRAMAFSGGVPFGSSGGGGGGGGGGADNPFSPPSFSADAQAQLPGGADVQASVSSEPQKPSVVPAVVGVGALLAILFFL